MHSPICTAVARKPLNASVSCLGRQEGLLCIHKRIVKCLGTDTGLKIGHLSLLNFFELAPRPHTPLLSPTIPDQPGIAALGRLTDHFALARVEHLIVVGDNALDLELLAAEGVLLPWLLFVAKRGRLLLRAAGFARCWCDRQVFVF